MNIWQTLCASSDPKFLVKGAELAQTLWPVNTSRWAIIETRAIDADRVPSVVYRVRDAETVTDAELRDGKRPQIVGTFDTFDGAMEWVQTQATNPPSRA